MTIRHDDIWYAARHTRIIHRPDKKVETFGETSVHYFLVSELLDSVGQVRVREGLIEARRPRLITPGYLIRRLTENFGREAERYGEWLVASGEAVRLLEYGLSFNKRECSEQIVAGDPATVAGNILKEKNAAADDAYGLIIGVDDLWEVSLLRFASQLIQESLPRNLQELAGRGLLDASGQSEIPAGIRVEIENDFHAARGNRKKIKQLGRKLQEFGVFREYEDRLYRMLRDLPDFDDH